MKPDSKTVAKPPSKRKRDSNSSKQHRAHQISYLCRSSDEDSQPSSSLKKPKSNGQLVSVTQLEAALLDPDAPSINPLADLLVHARSSRATPADVHSAIFALYRVFVSLISRGLFAPGSSLPAEVKTWLYARLDEYTALLASLLVHEEDALKVRCRACRDSTY